MKFKGLRLATQALISTVVCTLVTSQLVFGHDDSPEMNGELRAREPALSRYAYPGIRGNEFDTIPAWNGWPITASESRATR